MENLPIRLKLNFKKFVIVLSTIVVLNLFFNYGIKTFYKAPVFNDFCAEKFLAKSYDTKEKCESVDVGGLWTEGSDVYYEKTYMMEGETSAVARPVPMINDKTPKGWCNASFTCGKNFETANSLFNRNVFIILVVAGIVSLIISLFVAVETVSLGLSFGGLLSLIVGTIRYWSNMDEYLRFIVLGIALAILIWMGVKKVREE